MTLKGGETPGKETVYLKGGGAVTLCYVKGTLLRGPYWHAKGENAVPGRFDSKRKAIAACQAAKDRRDPRRGGGSGVTETRETWLTLLGLSSPKAAAPVKAGRVKPPKHLRQNQPVGKKQDKWAIGWWD